MLYNDIIEINYWNIEVEEFIYCVMGYGSRCVKVEE